MLHSISASSVGPSDIQLGTESRFSLAPLQSVAQSSAFPAPLEHLLLLAGASLVRVCWTRGLKSRCTVTIINYFTLIDQWLEWTDQWFLQCVFPSWCDSVQSATFKDYHLPSLWCCHQSCSPCTCRGTQEEGLQFTQRLKVIKQEECRVFFFPVDDFLCLVYLFILAKEKNITELHLKKLFTRLKFCAHAQAWANVTLTQLALYFINHFCWFPLHIDFSTSNHFKLDVFTGN